MTNITTGQTKIATTGTLQQLPSSGTLTSGVHIFTPIGNTKPIAVTTNPSGSGAVDGTGSGVIISPGGSAFFPVANAESLLVGGTSADVVSWSAY